MGAPTTACLTDLQCTAPSVQEIEADGSRVPVACCCFVYAHRELATGRALRGQADHSSPGTGAAYPPDAQAMDCAVIPGRRWRGYYAALLAATKPGIRILPMHDHRFGSLPPGTGAGDGCGCSRVCRRWRLQAPGRHGAKGYDVTAPEFKEQVESSVGGKFA